MGRMRTSPAGLELIKGFEGFRERAARLPGGGWIVGYGHTRAARDGLQISPADAEALLREYDLPPVERAILASVHAPLNQNEFDALVSFAFNLGAGAFMQSETRSKLNSGERLAAAEAMTAWRKARVGGRLMVVDALVRRRAAERALFLESPSGPAAAPSALLRPQLDVAASIMIPRETPVAVDLDDDDEETGDLFDPDRVLPLDAPEVAKQRETAPEAAARKVDERLRREIGAPPAMPETAKPSAPGAEDIARAVSSLAARQETKAPKTSQTSSDKPSVVDDLEPVNIADEDIARAIEAHERLNGEHKSADMSVWGPFAALAGLGAVLVVWGVAKMAGLVGSGRTASSEMEVFSGPILVLAGLLLAGVMSYYMVQALDGRDE